MNQSAAHTALLKEIMALCGSREDCRLWQNNTGLARALTHNGKIKFGLKGSADIIGIGAYHWAYTGPDKKPPIGIFLAIEVKTGSARQMKQQAVFQAMIEKFGGYYLVARSAQEVQEWLDRVLG